MIQAFYTAALGAHQQMRRMDVQGNNIANVNTNGYKAEQASFISTLYRAQTGVDNAKLPRGSGSRIVNTATDFSSGPLDQTGRDLDYAIVGDGYFALYNRATGETSYTRDGAFTAAPFAQPNGGEPVYYLSDGEGRQVLDARRQPIVITDTHEQYPVGVFSVPREDGMQHLDSSRFALTAKNGNAVAIEGKVVQGYLESSNTDLPTEFGKMIEAQHSYSYALKMMLTADEVETTINNLTT